jgi:hypothetical protein
MHLNDVDNNDDGDFVDAIKKAGIHRPNVLPALLQSQLNMGRPIILCNYDL